MRIMHMPFLLYGWKVWYILYCINVLYWHQQGHTCSFSARNYSIINQVQFPHLSPFWALGLSSEMTWSILNHYLMRKPRLLSILRFLVFFDISISCTSGTALMLGILQWGLLCSQNLGNRGHSTSYALGTYYAPGSRLKPRLPESIFMLSCLERLEERHAGK